MVLALPKLLDVSFV